MEVKLLAKGYKTDDTLYQDFLEGKISEKEDYFSKEVVYIREALDFPIYMGKGSEEEKKQDFLEAFQVISHSYLNTDRDLLLDETFWHSLLLTHKREYILQNYPDIRSEKSKFYNIVLKKFDWENYIYKTILGAQYINDNIRGEDERKRFYKLIIENLDLYNYIIKYEIFRNDKFLVNILSIIDELQLSKVMKTKIKGREDLGDDERVGRRVIFEFNKSYPVVMSPMLDKEELKRLFVEYLSYYYDISQGYSHEEHLIDEMEIEKLSKEDGKALVPNYEYSYQEKSFFESNAFSREGVDGGTDLKEDLKAQVVQPSIKGKETIDLKEKIKSGEEDELLAYLEEHNLEYVDRRSKGGSIWVIGDNRIEAYLKPLEDEGIRFRYKPVGGRASKYRPAWFWYER
ncbi:hypothetical protein ACFO3D_16225 [Virgibacillus kekensis]|uniref:Uncharacterized protein n=1 Tax=Virgibacillus kekensis TaxID=202261 RepID=A0ABV9DN14_9BACI